MGLGAWLDLTCVTVCSRGQAALGQLLGMCSTCGCLAAVPVAALQHQARMCRPSPPYHTHSTHTPEPPCLLAPRNDALLAGAKLAQVVEAAALGSGSPDTVATTGKFEVAPGAVNRWALGVCVWGGGMAHVLAAAAPALPAAHVPRHVSCRSSNASAWSM